MATGRVDEITALAARYVEECDAVADLPLGSDEEYAQIERARATYADLERNVRLLRIEWGQA